MMYATAGNLDTFLLTRSHAMPPNALAEDIGDADSLGQLPKFERIKAFKKRRASGVGKKKENRGVMMLGVHEILSLFGDVVDGLAFLVGYPYTMLNVRNDNEAEYCAAQQFDSPSRPKVLKCASALGGRRAYVSNS